MDPLPVISNKQMFYTVMIVGPLAVICIILVIISVKNKGYSLVSMKSFHVFLVIAMLVYLIVAQIFMQINVTKQNTQLSNDYKELTESHENILTTYESNLRILRAEYKRLAMENTGSYKRYQEDLDATIKTQYEDLDKALGKELSSQFYPKPPTSLGALHAPLLDFFQRADIEQYSEQTQGGKKDFHISIPQE